MKAVVHEAQRLHDPEQFLVRGRPQPSPEQPARIDALLEGVKRLGLEVEAPADRGIGPIASVHSADYLAFLQTIHAAWQTLPGASAEVIPNVHPCRQAATYPDHPVGRAGFHQADTACPIGAETWRSAYWSAQAAIAAADLVLAGEPASYALCRPPGHHAYADMAGGFCFLNNAAIAAARCLAPGRRPVVLDIDLHHGNGTQGIFYARREVLTVSVHVDPHGFYPFFWGHAHEHGQGAGLGCNLNLPLPLGTGDDGFLAGLARGIAQIRAFGADVLVLAAGLDAFEGDPFGGLKVTTEGFAQIGRACAEIGLPTVIVQEGGYLSPELTTNLVALLGGFRDGQAALR
jgi:acetoin utilization deacetylase AcuC-like enzyme